MSLRKFVFWCHLVVGVVVGAVIFMMSVTGLLLTYEAQLNRWDLRTYRSPAATTESELLTLDTALVSVTEREPTVTPTSLQILADIREPVAVNVGSGRLLFVDRQTAKVVGDNDRTMRRFLREVMYWHRWFALDDERRLVGRTITSISNLVFLFLVLSGFYLWWPRDWSLHNVRQVIWFRRGLTGRARNFNWHNVVGFWLLVPLVVIVFSGSVISYRWMSDISYRLVGDSPPPPSGTSATNRVRYQQQQLDLSKENRQASYQDIFESASNLGGEWRSITVRLPDQEAQTIVALIDHGNGRQPSRQHELVFNRFDGSLVGRSGYPTYSRGRKFRRWLRFAHTGEVYGVAGQTIAGFATTGATVLVWTGFVMAWRRFRRRKSTLKQSKPY